VNCDIFKTIFKTGKAAAHFPGFQKSLNFAARTSYFEKLWESFLKSRIFKKEMPQSTLALWHLFLKEFLKTTQ
jgi:hypothetical protein